MTTFKCILVACACITISQVHTQEIVRWVDPRIGTDKSDIQTVWGAYGGTYPGAVLPWGAVQLSPETRRSGERGYFYRDSTIYYFTCVNHNSGYPEGSHGNPEVVFASGDDNSYARQTGQSFNHAGEQVQPGYYAVRFDDGSQVELTATTRTGMFRYRPAKAPFVVSIADALEIRLIDERTVAVGRNNGHFVFNRPWTSQQLEEGKLTLQFDRLPGEEGLLVKAGFSTVSREGSAGNLAAENPGWDFETIRTKAGSEWEKELSVVRVETDNPVDMTKFYTALYHAFLVPCILSDVDGRYRGGDGKIHRTERANAYGRFSTWDTFRSLHPLLCLLKPDRQLDMICSMLDIYDQQGYLPFTPMIGYHPIPVIVDTYQKDITGFDTGKAYQAMRKCLLGNQIPRQDTYPYIRDGFLNDSIDESVSVTLDYAYNDWALSVFAGLTGHEEDARLLRERAFNYRRLFDTQTRFMLPRNRTGFVRNPGEMGYKEADKWTTSWFVPHNVQDLINLSGGDACFTGHLLDAMENGHVLHDNETVLHYPYLFSYAGRPDLTCQWVDRIREMNYTASPGGIPGNDDLGAMSSWYVFSALGFFPLCPGRPEYVLVTPLFASATLHMGNGKTMRITADRETIHHCFSGLQRNELPCQKLFITHRDLMAGGTLHFLGDTLLPDISAYRRPGSVTAFTPVFHVDKPRIIHKTVKSNQETYLLLTVANRGAAGVFPALITEEGQPIAEKMLFVEQGATVTDSVPLRLYAEGKHSLSFDRYKLHVRVESAGKDPALNCILRVKEPVVRKGEKVHMEVSIQNISGKTISGQWPVYAGDSVVDRLSCHLKPGHTVVETSSILLSRTGFHHLKVMEQIQTVNVYEQPEESCVLSVDFDRQDETCIYDASGFDNHGTLRGTATWERRGQGGALYINGDAYIDFPLSESLCITGNTITLTVWIYPTGESTGHIDFFTKGDYHVFQVSGGKLSFFAGGWGRGTCSTPLPRNWLNHWHHIAGVCDGQTLKLYLNGELRQTLPVEGGMRSTEIPWNLGRNAEMPYSRRYKGWLDEVRIYKDALTDEAVRNLYKAFRDIENPSD
ncbi:MAG: GH92 family glycosyl hydrolase [Tannerella sp.]|jgi:putative alpha-1,2-mannosidase|nr:GH92 family glycosyl hydrolase [Tannerella sp.]